MGAMAVRLARSFDYRGYEPDPRSFHISKTRLQALGTGEVFNDYVPRVPDCQFDLLVAFEVLEHIEDDKETLKTWCRWVSPGGHVLLSVPAKPDRFGPTDRLVGHYRRYSRDGLASLMAAAGLEDITIQSWGMPVGYLLEAIRNRLARAHPDPDRVGTPGSGRLNQPPGFLGRVVEWSLWPLAALQKPFVRLDAGVGFIAAGAVTDR
jgi:SAM-dependent methyltransferase